MDDRTESVFVVRTWLEVGRDGRTMRGVVHKIGSDQRRYFANFGGLCDFISAQWLSPCDHHAADHDGGALLCRHTSEENT